MIGYHFVGEMLRDCRPVPPDGEWLEHEGEVVPCLSGLHMSACPFDALRFAPGPILCKVELEGDIRGHGVSRSWDGQFEKYAGRRRRIIKRFDATDLMFRFAADRALSVAYLWSMPDAVVTFLRGPDCVGRRPGAGTIRSTLATLRPARQSGAAVDSAIASLSECSRRAAIDASVEASRAVALEAAWRRASAFREPEFDAEWEVGWESVWGPAKVAAAVEFKRRIEAVFAS